MDCVETRVLAFEIFLPVFLPVFRTLQYQEDALLLLPLL